MEAEAEFQDIPTVALLMLKGWRLGTRVDGSRVVFHCPRDKQLGKVLSNYLDGTLQVSALEYGETIQRVKALIRAAKYNTN